MTAQEIADLFRALELELVASLKRNLSRHIAQEKGEGGKNGVPERWEAWQSAKLREMQRFRAENRQIVAKYAPVIDRETRQMITEQYQEGGADGFFTMNDRRVKALLGEMQQAEQTSEKAALRYMDDVYRRTIRKTALGMAAGSMTVKQAVDDATKDFLRLGIRCIRYKDGRQVNIASYAEMALRTAGTRATLQGEAALRESLGIDTVLVSEYGGCSDTCLPWQGLVYIDDVFQVYNGPHTPGGTYGISCNGKQYPLLSVAMKAGLFHPNCRHTLTTWFEGISTRPKPMDKAKIEATSRLEAKQRAMERAIRQAKREAEGLQDEQAAAEARRRVRDLQKQLKEFVDTHGDVLRRDPWRERYDLPEVPDADILKDNEIKYIRVTTESVNAVRSFECQTLDTARQNSLALAHKRLLAQVSAKPEGTEAARCYGLDMQPLGGLIVGDRVQSVKIPDYSQPYIAIHNHPSGLTFSPADIQQFAERPNMQMLTAVGNNGKVYAIERGQCYSQAGLKALSDKFHKKVMKTKTKKEVFEAIDNFYKEVQQYGVYFYATGD